jgi:hypothetical protein
VSARLGKVAARVDVGQGLGGFAEDCDATFHVAAKRERSTKMHSGPRHHVAIRERLQGPPRFGEQHRCLIEATLVHADLAEVRTRDRGPHQVTSSLRDVC